MSSDCANNTFLDSKKFKVIALSVGQGLNSIIIIVVGMVMARVLAKDEVAAYQQTFLAYRTVAPFLCLGIGNGIYYFLPAEKERIRGRVFDSITVLSGMGLLFALMIALGGNQLLAQRFSNPKVAELLLWMIPYALFMVPASHQAAVLVSQGRAAFAAVFSTVAQLLIGLGAIIPLLIWHDEEYALIGNVIVSCLTAICSIILMIRISPKDRSAVSGKAMRELVKYSFPLGLATMVATLSLSMDKLLVSALLTPEDFAVYSYGAREIPLIGLLVGSLASVIMVQMRQDVAKGNILAAAHQFRRSTEYTAPLLFPVASFFVVNSKQFVELMFTTEYSGAAIPFAIYSFTALVRCASFGSLLGAHGQNWFILSRTMTGLIINGILSYYAILAIGATGAAWATLFVLLFVATPLNYHRLMVVSRCKIWDLVPGKKLLFLSIIFLVLVAVQYFIVNSTANIAIYLNGVIIGIVVLILNKKTFLEIVALKKGR